MRSQEGGAFTNLAYQFIDWLIYPCADGTIIVSHLLDKAASIMVS
jgi:hypothetical protein